ncbi:MAG: flippase-like domain-containing protein [Magnetovibrio sp.]|nr:flippase-like domain-containing protein [Magnetovibrio sp.]
MPKKHLLLALKFFVSFGVIFVLLNTMNTDTLMDIITSAKIDMVLWAAVVVAIQVLAATSRWHTVIIAINSVLSYGRCLWLYTIGLFFNQLLPSSVGGDAVRIYKAYKSGLTLKSSVHSVMLERAATMLGLVVVFVLTLPKFLTDNNYSDVPISTALISLLVLGTIVGVIILTHLHLLPTKLRSWKLLKLLIDLSSDARKLFLTPKHLSLVMLWSILGHVFIALKVYFLALAVGIDASFVECTVVTVMVLLVMMLPISIAGWGVREGAMVGSFGLIGVPAESALAASLLFGMLGIIQAIPGAIIWLKQDPETKETPPQSL